MIKQIYLIALILPSLLQPNSQLQATNIKMRSSNSGRREHRQVLNVKDFHAQGDGQTDDTAAFAAALRKLSDAGGTLIVPPGTYLVGDLSVASGLILKGLQADYSAVLLKAPNAKTILNISPPVGCNSALPLHDIALQYLTFRGRSVEDGFSEHIHNVNVAGVERLSFTRVRFEAFQGDGLYLGALAAGSSTPLHNSEINVSDSSFDGVNSQNRNGISVIDCTHCVFEHNDFSRVSRPDMPGAIDLEPNHQEEVIQYISVKSNTIKDGRGAGVSVSVNLSRFLTEPSHISIEGNQIRNTTKGIVIYWKSIALGSETATPQVLIRGNLIDNAEHAMIMDGTGAIAVIANDIVGSSQGLQLGTRFGISNVRFINNTFRRVGTNSRHGITIAGPVTSLVFERNTFEDLGSRGQNSSAVYCIQGAVKDVTFTGNIFSSPKHQTIFAIATGDRAEINLNVKRWKDNDLKDGIRPGLPVR